MSELQAIARAVEGLRRRQEPFLLATVVRVSGSSYRRPGARMLVTRDGWVAGSISGGCLEADVLKRGWWSTRDAAARLVTYDGRPDGDRPSGGGAGCDGTVDVLLETSGREGLDPFALVARCRETQQPCAIATLLGAGRILGARIAVQADGTVLSDPLDEPVVESTVRACRRALGVGRSEVVRVSTAGVEVEAFVEVLRPPPRLFVVGAGHDAVAVVTLARTLGWETVVCEASARFSTRERFAHADRILAGDPSAIACQVEASDRAMAVIMSHDYERDRACLAALVETRAAYLGVLGPRQRTARMAEDRGLRLDPRVHAPVGLDLGGETPQEIALSIVSEAQAALARASAVRLRDQAGPIHGPAAGRMRVAAVVLAAGESRRLGRPKQLVPFGEQPLLRALTAEACASCVDRVAVVVPSSAPEVAGCLRGLDVDVVPNPEQAEGMAASVRRAVSWADRGGYDGVVLLVCDQPALTTAHVDELVRAFQPGISVVASRYAGVTGVPALFARRMFGALLGLRGPDGAKSLIRAQPDVVAVDWPEGAFDVDLPEDVARLRRPRRHATS